MRNSRSKLIRYSLLALLLIVVGLITFVFLTREPTYEGKPLSYWLDQLPCTFLVDGGHSRTSPFAYKTAAEADADRARVEDVTRRALRAVSTIGTNHLDVAPNQRFTSQDYAAAMGRAARPDEARADS